MTKPRAKRYTAAEREGRIGYASEIDPAYVAVTLERLADTGLTPELTE